jgi:hypothetical protein
LHSQPATQNIAPGTGISIGTAANTLVFIGASASDLQAFLPYYLNTANDAKGPGPAGINAQLSGNTIFNLSTGQEYLLTFEWKVPILAKAINMKVSTAYTGGTSNLYATLYAVSAAGYPGKLLYDFGVLGTAASSLASTGYIKSTVGNGFYMFPGEYWLRVIPLFSGGSGTPALIGGPSTLNTGRMGAWTGSFNSMAAPAAFGGNGTWGSISTPDPWQTANANQALAQSGSAIPGFTLSES